MKPPYAPTPTDAKGEFYFPVVYKTSLRAIFTLYVRIIFHHEGKEYLAWKKMKDNYDLNGDAVGLEDNNERYHYLMDIICDISQISDQPKFISPFWLLRLM